MGLIDTRLTDWDSSNCAKVLGIDRNTLWDVAHNKINVYDARSDSSYATLRQRDVVDNVVDTTLANSRDIGAWAVTIKGTTTVAVAFYANFFLADNQQQQNTVLHEMLHAIGWSHDTLVEQFSSNGLRGVFDISDWLQRDCAPIRWNSGGRR